MRSGQCCGLLTDVAGAKRDGTRRDGWDAAFGVQACGASCSPGKDGRCRYASERPGSSTAGFTLIEIVVVVIILGLLVGLVGPEIVGRVGQSRVETARAQIEMLATQLDLYRLDNGTYPTTEQGLDALWEKPTSPPVPSNWRGPYSRKPIPLDPWGQTYVYRYPGVENPAGYDLASHGADRQTGGEGEAADIKSWER